MNDLFDFAIRALFIGIGATLVMDLWGVFQKRVLGIQSLNYCLLGRWIGHFPRGQFVHANIAQSARVRGECRLGWSAHYGIGIGFAALLLAVWGKPWAENPTLGPALVVGIGTIAAPFFLLQPGMGAGIAASKTPRPNAARLRSLVTHTVYGLGLYLAGCLWAFIYSRGGRGRSSSAGSRARDRLVRRAGAEDVLPRRTGEAHAQSRLRSRL